MIDVSVRWAALPGIVVALLLALASFGGCEDPGSGSQDDDRLGDDDAGDDDLADDDTGDDDAGDDDSGDDDTGDDDTGDDDTGDDDTTPLPDLAQAGPYSVDTTTDWATPSGWIPTQITVYSPVGAPAAPHVVLAHGFSRHQGVFADLAEHYASWGLTVVTMTLLHIYVIDNDPMQDAADLMWLSDEYGGGGPVIFAGHSAGGMRSVIAGAQDPDTVAVMGLDLVDYADAAWGNVFLALEYAPQLAEPLWGLAGESGECNAEANALPAYAAAADGNVLRVTEADHCDFEDPTDTMCTMLCEGTNDQFTDDEIKATIRELSTAFLLWQAGLDPAGERWWTPGEQPYDDLVNAGAVTQL
jgi:pimeloyl-ACP methyl ester carboxylesterase